MKLINPIGRTVNSIAEDHFDIHPRACMCGSSANAEAYAGAKGSDGCFHCGCNCGMSSGNSGKATYTIRSSSV